MPLPNLLQAITGAESIATRSFGGCDTCRSRRVKCDEARPTCLLCRTTGLTCGGYGRNIFFTTGNSEGGLDAEGIRFRRLLFTETERRDMSIWITSSVPPALVSKQLSKLEEQCESITPNQTIELQCGPFGVFESKLPKQTYTDASEQEVELNWSQDIYFSKLYDMSPETQHSTDPENAADQQLSPTLIASILEDSAEGLLPSVPDLCDSNDLPNTTSADCTQRSMMEMQELALFSTAARTMNISESPLSMDLVFSQYTGPSATPMLTTVPMPIPGDAIFLLKHYTSNVVNFITPFGHTKTPWHTLFIPHVKTCLAALTMGEDLSHASLAIFFGTLAISASSLGRKTQSHSSVWLERAKMYERQAREHCRTMLETAYDVPKVAKYKTILMALLTLVHLYTLTGRRRCIDFYFVEAEKFIRLRGLSRRKSRKVRLLHHCYAFQRMFYESLCIGYNSFHRQEVQKAIESSDSLIYSQDSLSFHKFPRNLPQEMLMSKTQEEGENDLHLERPGLWPATLYPEIYGIPEVLVAFLSFAIRLGKEKDAAEQGYEQYGSNIADFLKRAKNLESCIKEYHHESNIFTTYSTDSNAVKFDNLADIIEALRSALSIYFYRRIYDVDSSILQPMVSTVLECLARIQRTSAGGSCGSLSLVWPAFIAACEAEDPTIQAGFCEWFETCAQNSGLDTFTVTIKTVRDVWKARSTTNGKNINWIDLAKGKGKIG